MRDKLEIIVKVAHKRDYSIMLYRVGEIYLYNVSPITLENKAERISCDNKKWMFEDFMQMNNKGE